MSRILPDENVPIGLSKLLPDHEVRHVVDEGWTGVLNGALITAAENAGYEARITADKNLTYQQNLRDRKLSLIVIASNNWNEVRRNQERIKQAIEWIGPGSDHAVDFERTRGRGRKPTESDR